jgi:tRNA threonylcarbamoyladenosine biosynthesis protein TsaB
MASAALWTDCAEPGAFEPDVASPLSFPAYEELPPEAGKADQLILAVERLLETTGRGYADLDVIAVNRGPGSFTGVRSAVALGRGLALATGRPVIGVATHEALAASIGPSGNEDATGSGARPRLLMIAQDARRGQVYVQRFDQDRRPLDEPRAETPEQAAADLEAGRWRLEGSGAALVRAFVDNAADIIMMDEARLDARGVAQAAHVRLMRGEDAALGFELRPLYLRAPDAVRPKPLMSPKGALNGVPA